MNTQLLSKVQHNILSNPARFDTCEDFDTDITGFAVAAAGLNPSEVDCYTKARKLLRITAGQRDALCLLHLWPRQFRRQFEPEPTNARQLKMNAQIAAARIAHFARTGC